MLPNCTLDAHVKSSSLLALIKKFNKSGKCLLCTCVCCMALDLIKCWVGSNQSQQSMIGFQYQICMPVLQIKHGP